MNRLLLLLFLLASFTAIAQPGQLFVKKGVFKKKVFTEGDRIHLLLRDGKEKKGLLTHIRDSVVFINGEEIPASQIATILIDDVKKNHLPDLKTMLLIGGGVGLTTIGLSLNHANEPKTAFLSALTIGYGPILLKFFGGRILYAFKRKKYKLGKKFHLQVFDIRIPPKRPF